jgi:hypothetical protein
MRDSEGNRLCDYVTCNRVLDVGTSTYVLGFFVKDMALCREHYKLLMTIAYPPKKQDG